MIPTSYFHKQAMRSRETVRWFSTLKDTLLELVQQDEDSLHDYSGAWPILAVCYETKKTSNAPEDFEIENGNVKLEMHVNNPIGWITVTVTKKFGFERNEYRGAICAHYVSASENLREPDHYVMHGLGFLAEFNKVKDVADKLSALLFESELAEADCVYATLTENTTG